MQNIICAKSSVAKPFFAPKALKNIRRPIAVTISGFIIGRLFICSTVFLSIGFDLDRPIDVIVPTIVDIIVARTAITIV